MTMARIHDECIECVGQNEIKIREKGSDERTRVEVPSDTEPWMTTMGAHSTSVSLSWMCVTCQREWNGKMPTVSIHRRGPFPIPYMRATARLTMASGEQKTKLEITVTTTQYAVPAKITCRSPTFTTTFQDNRLKLSTCFIKCKWSQVRRHNHRHYV